MTLFERLGLIPDPRNDINIKHDLVDVVFSSFPLYSVVQLDGSPFKSSVRAKLIG